MAQYLMSVHHPDGYPERTPDELQKAFEAFKEAERKASDARDFEAFLRSRGEGGSSQG